MNAVTHLYNGVAAPEPTWDPKLPFFTTLRFRLIVSVAIVHAVLMGLFVWDAVSEQSDSIRAELQNRGKALTSLMSVATTNALLAEDLASLAEVTVRIRDQADVQYGEVLDAHGNVLASTDGQRIGQRVVPRVEASESMPYTGSDEVLDMRENIEVAGRVVGSVYLGMSTDSLHRALLETRNEGLFFIVVALVAGTIAAWALSFATTRNLHAMIDAVRRITRGDLDVRVTSDSRDEAGVLAHAFNAMVVSLQTTSNQVRQEHEKRTEAERLACVGELSASIAHEIRNPLSAIINSVKLLSRGDITGGDREQVVDIVNAESDRLQRTLNEFLTFARIPESKLGRNDLCRLVHDTLALLSNDPTMSPTVGLEARVPNAHCSGRFDADQIRQVLVNLVMNSVQAMPDGGTVTVEARPRGDRLTVRVIDTGTGIPDALLDKVTRPFVTGRSNGTGLGLSIVQRILMQHGTKLQIGRHGDKGTEVSFELEAV